MYETRGWEEKNKKLVDRVSKMFMVVSVADPAWRIEGLVILVTPSFFAFIILSN